jgi:hypothetical protein
MGLVAPPSSAGLIARLRGILIFVALIVAILAIAFGIVTGISAAAGGLSLDLRIFYSLVLVVVVFVGTVMFGRRRMRAAQAKRAAAASGQ